MSLLDEMLNAPRSVTYRNQATHLLAAFRKRNIDGSYHETTSDAVEEICRLIPSDSCVALGGSVTIVQSGLIDALRTMRIDLLDRYRADLTAADVDAMRVKGMSADVLITSCNAITADGKLVCEDGLGNRVAGLIFGPKKVIVIAGINKLVSTVDEALTRIKTVAAPMNCVRLGKDTPCARTGFCDDDACAPPERICSQIVVIESNSVTGRITVVLVGASLGF